MTKVNENGQLEWTFEELDLEGALKEVIAERDSLYKSWKNEVKSVAELRRLNNRVCDLEDVILNLNWLIRRGK